jgi:tRNA(Arg) A34 adenosine deaminase TadA
MNSRASAPQTGGEYSPVDDGHVLAAIELSEEAAARGDYPFGAVLVDATGDVVAAAGNTMVTARDTTAHAEINLLRSASARLEPDDLATCTLYVSAEPCAMCAGAIYWANVRRVVYGLGTEALQEVVGNTHDIPVLELSCRDVFARCGHAVDVSGPHREAEARAVHEHFWSDAKAKR